MERHADAEKVAALRDEIRMLTRALTSLRLALVGLSLCLVLALSLTPAHKWATAACIGISNLGGLLALYYLARQRKRLRLRLAALPYPERGEVLDALEKDRSGLTRDTVAMLREQADKDGILTPASPPEGRGDEPAAT